MTKQENDRYIPYSGVCPRCKSTNLWNDNAHFGCNKCRWTYIEGNIRNGRIIIEPERKQK